MATESTAKITGDDLVLATGQVQGMADGTAATHGATVGQLTSSTTKGLKTTSNKLELATSLTSIRWDEDWNSATTAGRFNWVTNTSTATVTQVATGADATHDGIVQLSKTSGAGRAAIAMFPNTLPTITPGTASHEIYCEWWVQVPTLSDGSDTFQVFAGLGSVLTSATQSNGGVGFLYDKDALQSAGDAHWQYYTNDGTASITATTVTVTAGQWYRLAVKKASGANSWTFYIDGVSVASGITTHAPTTKIGPMAIIIGGAGSNARTVLLDGCNGYKAYDSARYA